jgi:hypothetical protein
MTRNLSFAIFFAAFTLAVRAEAGVHVGNIYLGLYDDGSPVVSMHPDDTPRLALLTCGAQSPTILTAEYDENGRAYFALNDDIGEVCAVGLDFGSPLDLRVAGVFVATVEPTPIGFVISATPVEDLVGATIRAGTATMMSEVRAIAAVPRTATSSESALIESALSVIILDLP